MVENLFQKFIGHRNYKMHVCRFVVKTGRAGEILVKAPKNGNVKMGRVLYVKAAKGC